MTRSTWSTARPSGLSGSDGDSVYTFDVTPDALGQVTVDIAAGVATDGEGNDNTAAPQLSLGIPYDFNGNGVIGRTETIAAIRDYFDGNITRGQAIAVIRLYFSPPAEPDPGPGPNDGCIQTVCSDGMLDGQWSSGCDSEERSGSHARYYRFTLDASSEITVTLESGAANTYLYLRQGVARSGKALDENDDYEGIAKSKITATLTAGSYTIEATTYGAGETGAFILTVSGLVETTGTPTTPPDPCGESISGDEATTGQWAAGCDSTDRPGSYARYYNFILGEPSAVTITLESSDADTYLYLRQGDARSGTALHENDDYEGSTQISQISALLDAGTYTVEATTIGTDVTGEFTLTIMLADAALPDMLVITAEDFSWGQDGLTEDERTGLRYLQEIGRRHPDILQTILEFSWVNEEISELESKVIGEIFSISAQDSSLARMLVNCSWVADGIDDDDWWTLFYFASLTRDDVLSAKRLASYPWFSDHLTSTERAVIARVSSFVVASVPMGRRVAGFRWLSDDISGEEGRLLGLVGSIANIDTTLAVDLLQLPWLGDEVTPVEARTLHYLWDIAHFAKDSRPDRFTAPLTREDLEFAFSVVNMPIFSGEIRSLHEDLAKSLWSFYLYQRHKLELVIEQSWYQDGLTEEEAALVVVLSGTEPFGTFNTLLQGGEVQSTSVLTPMAGEINLFVVRQRPSQSSAATLASMSAGIKEIEDFLNVPWRKNDVIAYVDPSWVVYGGGVGAGLNLGTHIRVGYTEGTQQFKRTLYHELVHFYLGTWVDGPGWIEEGSSDFLASYTEHRTEGASLQARYNLVQNLATRSCGGNGVSNISGLVRTSPIVWYVFAGRTLFAGDEPGPGATSSVRLFE